MVRSPIPQPAVPPVRIAPQPLGALRRAVVIGAVRLARRVMTLFVRLAGERCWDCGKKITPTVKLPSYQIVEARLWAWEEVVCDLCVRSRLTRFGGKGPKH
ncbi:MAG: hypothetical protein AVDCRST_MAG77-2184 [uncultured Chloroflexi bacterium]|uniref:Uncharacterized protein n=1 Tax=uncultured Chloroflexota bacterium TaxID=166587 RepID=A0A6J4IGR7_9CHLR|nr:MAG: hypothetical protein AVDCRST_MAG77-2184 [uncultured Chloroflexota bacterium]